MWYNYLRNFFVTLGSGLLIFTLPVMGLPSSVLDLSQNSRSIGLAKNVSGPPMDIIDGFLDGLWKGLFYVIVTLVCSWVVYILIRIFVMVQEILALVNNLTLATRFLRDSDYSLTREITVLRNDVELIGQEVDRIGRELRESSADRTVTNTATTEIAN